MATLSSCGLKFDLTKNDHIWKNLGNREIIGTYLESSNLLLLFDVYLIEFEKTKFQYLKSSTITTIKKRNCFFVRIVVCF